MARTKHSPGKFGHAPVNGRYFYVHRQSRCVRVWDMTTQPVPAYGWEQVSLAEWEAFRKETLTIPLKKRKQLHATLYEEKECPKSTKSLKPSKSSTQATSPSKPGRTRSALPQARCRKKVST